MTVFPRLMLVTQRARMKPDFCGALVAALRGGARLIQLREKDLSEAELFLLATQAKALCDEYGATLLVNGAPDVARELGLGMHFSEGAGDGGLGAGLFGVSVHSVEAALRCGAGLTPPSNHPSQPPLGKGRSLCRLEEGVSPAYLVFGSVFETQSHPGAAPAGLEKLREVCAAVEIPVFAIGGVTVRNAGQCLAAGAHGVAVIGAAWDADDVEAAVRELISTTDGR